MRTLALFPCLAIVAGCITAGSPPPGDAEPRLAQNIDPYQENLRQLRELQQDGLRTREDVRTFREDQRRERLHRLSEQAYDRQMCIKAGYRGPDIDQCVRGSANYRRYGPSGPRTIQLPPELHCQTVDNGDGTMCTDCF